MCVWTHGGRRDRGSGCVGVFGSSFVWKTCLQHPSEGVISRLMWQENKTKSQ